MANEILAKQGTVKSFKNSGGSAAITLSSITNNSARQGVKLDLGATFDRKYYVQLIWYPNVAPTAGTYVEVWWSASVDSTAGTDNQGGADGTDSAYKSAEEDEWKTQLMYIGSLPMTADAAVQRGIVGIFKPPTRYGMPIVVNKSGQTSNASNTDPAVNLIPIRDEVQ